MSEMIIIECDYGDGNCIARIEGFSRDASDKFRQDYLQKKGWLVQEDKHYCPLHKEQVLKEAAIGEEK